MARPKGAKNKVGASAKENVLAVFTRIGGTAAMADWASDNRTEFYKLYAKLIPTQVTGAVSHTVVRTIDESKLCSELESSLAEASQATVQ